MSARPWMPLYVGDYRADTQHLTTAQHGAYLLLIMHYWQHGGLPDDDGQLARIVGMTAAEWKKNRPVIRPFFGKGWRHPRIERELKDAKERYERRASAGRKGNEVRWGRRNAIDVGSQSHSQAQSQSHHFSLSQGEEGFRVDDQVGLDSWPDGRGRPQFDREWEDEQ
jgi:uncharacterized protein YdaU (DUF1376 family)